ncbi:MAG: YcbK family protein [Deltaproteobacteria bacterium]|nr:YcbK family protein [Deltaproteobacteria bacterium]
MRALVSCAVATIVMVAAAEAAEFPGPFFYHGDGVVTLQGRQGGISRMTYRRAGQYDEAGLRRINLLFGAPWERPTERVSLRLIELLDHLQEHFGGAQVVLQSGYRSPEANTRLRTMGRLAAQSSLHMEGAAIDCHLQGVSSAAVFAYLKDLGCCGIGYYHGREVHIDAGPARFWDEATSGTENREPQQNEKIILATDRDRYRRGETAMLQFMRITDYPVIVPATLTLQWQRVDMYPSSGGGEVETERKGDWRSAAVTPTYPYRSRVDGCVALADRAVSKSIGWTVDVPGAPRTVLRGRLVARFCERTGDKMPAEIISNPFEIW